MSAEASPAPFQLSRYGRPALIAVGVAWIVVLGFILSHSLFVSHDSLSNYGHVWYVAEQLRSGGGLPFHMPVLGHGEALTFPYGFLPWLVGGRAGARPRGLGRHPPHRDGLHRRRGHHVLGAAGDPPGLVGGGRPREPHTRDGAHHRAAPVPVGHRLPLRRHRVLAPRPAHRRGRPADHLPGHPPGHPHAHRLPGGAWRGCRGSAASGPCSSATASPWWRRCRSPTWCSTRRSWRTRASASRSPTSPPPWPCACSSWPLRSCWPPSSTPTATGCRAASCAGASSPTPSARSLSPSS